MAYIANKSHNSLNVVEFTDFTRDALNSLTILLTLEVIGHEPTWGYKIKKKVEEIMSQYIEDYQFKISSLYTLLRRLEEKNGLIRSYYKVNNEDYNQRNNSRRWYRLTEVGKIELQKIRRNWVFIVNLYGIYPSFF